MKKKIALFVVLLFGAMTIAGCNNGGDGGYGSQSSGVARGGSVKEFNVIISGYTYSPPSITVNAGDRVLVTVTNNDQTSHGFSLAKFGVQDSIRPGQTKTIQFTANKAGGASTFCSTQHGEKLVIKVV